MTKHVIVNEGDIVVISSIDEMIKLYIDNREPNGFRIMSIYKNIGYDATVKRIGGKK